MKHNYQSLYNKMEVEYRRETMEKQADPTVFQKHHSIQLRSINA